MSTDRGLGAVGAACVGPVCLGPRWAGCLPGLRVLTCLVAVGPRGWRACATQVAPLFVADSSVLGGGGGPHSPWSPCVWSRAAAPLSCVRAALSRGRVTVWKQRSGFCLRGARGGQWSLGSRTLSATTGVCCGCAPRHPGPRPAVPCVFRSLGASEERAARREVSRLPCCPVPPGRPRPVPPG